MNNVASTITKNGVNTPQSREQNTYEVAIASLLPLEPGLTIDIKLNFAGNVQAIENLSGVEQIKYLIKALSHLKNGLQEQLNSFMGEQ